MADTTATTAQTSPAGAAPPPVTHSRRRSKWLLLVAAVLCYVIFSWVGGRLGISRTRGFDGSLLLSPGAAGNILVTAALILASVALGTLLAGGVRPDGGLFAAAAGLMALSIAGRPVYAVLHETGGGRSTFLWLAIELLLLYAFLGAGWWALYMLQQKGRLHRDAARDGLADIELPANAGRSAFTTHALIMAVLMLLLVQSEEKKQVLAAVGIASFCAAFFPYWQHGARPSVWYWTAPLAVGLAGYLLAFISPPLGAEIGRPGYAGGFLSTLARPLPLDYASVGTAGAILGYWMRRKSLREREAHAAAAALPPDIRQRLQQPQ